MAKESLPEMIKRLKEEARQSWSGEVGEERAERLEKYLCAKLKEYSQILNEPEEEILISWENSRNYSAINYYQEVNQPSLSKAKIFKDAEEMNKSIVNNKFRCSCCGGISTNPYECNSGLIIRKATKIKTAKICDFKVFGLFGDLRKGTYVFCKKEMKGEYIFIPIDWE